MQLGITLATLVSLLYLPIYSFSIGFLYKQKWSVHRLANPLSLLFLSPLSLIYFFLTEYIIGFSAYLKIILDNIIILGLGQFNLSSLVADPFFRIYSKQCTDISNKPIIFLILAYYFFFILLIPGLFGYLYSSFIQNKRFGVEQFKKFADEYKMIKFFTKNKAVSNILFSISFAMYWEVIWKSALHLFPAAIFRKIKGPIDYIVSFMFQDLIPEELKDVYDIDCFLIADITISEKKMITGEVSDVFFEKDIISAFLLSNPVKWERCQSSTTEWSDSKTIVTDSWVVTTKKKIPGKKILIPMKSCIDINLYRTEKEVTIFFEEKDMIHGEFNDFISKAKAHFAKSDFIFTNIYICILSENGNLDKESINNALKINKNNLIFPQQYIIIPDVDTFNFIHESILAEPHSACFKFNNSNETSTEASTATTCNQ